KHHPDWALGYRDEVWWCRWARPGSLAWAAEDPLRPREPPAVGDDGPKALARHGSPRLDTGGMPLRFVEDRPVSQATEDFLAWARPRLAAEGKWVLPLSGTTPVGASA